MIKATSRSRSIRRISFCLVSGLLCAGWQTAAVGQSLQTPGSGAPAFERCRTITDDAARLRCFEEATSPSPAGKAGEQGGGASAWRLVRTPNPAGGADAVSIMRTADPLQSDLDFAGLMLRCGDTGTEVLLVMVQPFPPRAHPHVTLAAGATSAEFIASTVPPGALLLLPAGAMALATSQWLTAPELVVGVKDDQGPIRGAVLLTGLASALQELRANCALR